MNYLLRNNLRSSRTSRYRGAYRVTGVVLVVLIVASLLMPHSTSGFFSWLFSPLWNIEQHIAGMEIFRTHASLVDENNALKQKISALSAADAALPALEQENTELKALLGRPTIKNTTAAVVLSKPPFSIYDTVVVDVGSEDHIVLGAKVYA